MGFNLTWPGGLKFYRWEVNIIISKLKRKQEGVYADVRKERTEGRLTEVASVPRELVYPLSMHIGRPAKPLVDVGDPVKIGTMIAEHEGHISANIHSSVSGKVVQIMNHPTAKGNQPCIIIENDYKDERESPLIAEHEELNPQKKLEIIAKAGIVGMGGASFPTNIKLSPKKDSKIDTLIINGAECEPYATADHRLMIENAKEIVDGIRVVLDIFPVEHAYIGIEDDSHECIAILNQEIADDDRIHVKELATIYPQGSEKNLIKKITGREVSPGQLPADEGTIVLNVATTYAIYEAVHFGRPLIKRITTVSGESLKTPKNLWVRIGTPIESLIQDCEGFQSDPGKMVHGGPMMGTPLTSGRVPITKGTTTVTFLNKGDAAIDERSPCIRCSECLNVCPVSLQPIMISNAYETGDIDRAEKLGALDCIDCGACSYICPSKIPILENIQKAKAEILARREGA